MQIKEKIVLLDFCETVVKFQTADRYVEYAIKNRKTIGITIRKLIYRLISYIGFVSYIERKFPTFSFNKRCVLSFLKGIPELDLYKSAEDYYNNVLKPNFITQTIEKIRLWKNQNYRIIILSGGYDIYLKYFVDEFGITDIVCTKIKFNKGICNGNFSSIDCLGENKIVLLEEYLLRHKILIDKKNSIAVSDSISDLPMLNYVDNQLIVCCEGKNTWHQNYGFNNFLLWN